MSTSSQGITKASRFHPLGTKHVHVKLLKGLSQDQSGGPQHYHLKSRFGIMIKTYRC